MSRFELIQNSTTMKQFIITDDNVRSVDKISLTRMLELTYLIRAFEVAILDLMEKGLVHGPVHSSVGQEAIAAGCGIALGRHDVIGSTHRAHHHFLGKALPCYYPGNYDPIRDSFSDEMHTCVYKTISEIMGLSAGWCKGRGGSMHLRNEEAGIIGTNAIVGGGIALTTGAAFAQKLLKKNNVAVSFLGDGAVNQGILSEALNMARLFNLPVTYFVENNLYAVATSIKKVTSIDNLAQRALAFGMDGIIVDGLDPVSIFLLMSDILKVQREESGAYFVEAKTYRFYHHGGWRNGHSFKYRTKSEEEQWRRKDPCLVFPKKLMSLGLLNENENAVIKNKIDSVVKSAVSKVLIEKNEKVSIPKKAWPQKKSLQFGFVGQSNEFDGFDFCEKKDFDHFVTLTFVNVISQVMARNMEKDPSVIILGIEVANFGGGAFSATKIPLRQFPNRVFNTPISEAGFTGIAYGASISGISVIVEIMYPDFALVAGDQLFNQIAKLKYLYGGNVDVNLVARTRVAMGLGYGAQHSSDPSGLFALFPGWRIVAPSNPFDYIGLFNSAITSKDPVLVIEHHTYYKEKGEVPRDTMDYFIALGKARIFRKGNDVTVVTYLKGVRIIEEIADELEKDGVSIEGVDLRSIDYFSIDYDTIVHSLKKTGRMIILEEAPKSMGIGSRIADEVQENNFTLLKSPIKHINSMDYPLPVSKRLEEIILIDKKEVKHLIKMYVKGIK
jgi:2-oxoisovalerate dehydrogenase E1 component